MAYGKSLTGLRTQAVHDNMCNTLMTIRSKTVSVRSSCVSYGTDTHRVDRIREALLFRANTSSIFRREGLQPLLALVDTSLVRRLHKPRPAIVIDALHDCVIHELIGAEVPPEPLNLRVVAIIKDEDTCRHEIPKGIQRILVRAVESAEGGRTPARVYRYRLPFGRAYRYRYWPPPITPPPRQRRAKIRILGPCRKGPCERGTGA